MLNETLLIGFIAASLVVLLIPGPGVLYVVARSTAEGYRAGLVSVLGLASGALVHVGAAALGVSAILLASATAFTIVKVLGAAYLIWLGLQILFSRRTAQSPDLTLRPQLSRLFLDGAVISVLNPKIAIFFLAYLPQFVDPAVGNATQQIVLLGSIYVALSLITDGGYALIAGRAGIWLRRHITTSRAPRVVTGATYIGLGLQAAFSERPK